MAQPFFLVLCTSPRRGGTLFFLPRSSLGFEPQKQGGVHYKGGYSIRSITVSAEGHGWVGGGKAARSCMCGVCVERDMRVAAWPKAAKAEAGDGSPRLRGAGRQPHDKPYKGCTAASTLA